MKKGGHYGLTGSIIKNLKMPKKTQARCPKLRQDSEEARTSKIFSQRLKIIIFKDSCIRSFPYSDI